MSLQDSLFAEDVEYDVTLFSKDNTRKREPGSNAVQQKESPSKNSYRGMGVEEQRSPSKSPERTHSQHQQRHQQKQTDSKITSTPKSITPAVEIYRPPPARKAKNESRTQLRETSIRSKVEDTNDNDVNVLPSTSASSGSSSSSSANVRNNRQRRPDRAVYVPRHRRSLEAQCTSRRSQEDNVVNQESGKSILSLSNNHICEEQDTVSQVKPICESASPDTGSHNNIEKQDSNLKGDYCSSSSIEVSISNVKIGNLEEDQEKQVEIDETTHLKTADQPIQKKSIKCEQPLQSEPSSSSQEINNITKEACNEVIVPVDELKDQICKKVECDEKPVVHADKKIISSDVDKDNELKENLTNRNDTVMKKNESNNTIRRNVVSDVLIISGGANKEPVMKKATQVPIIPVTPPEKKAKKIERQKSKPAPPPSPPIKIISRDECDWDSLFDDNGDCLDPSLIEELTSAVGEVVIEQPKNDYKLYSKQVEVSSDEFAHVVEIYNFPSDFKTSDLAAVFSPFRNGGFELKWVDDTHCLGVFSSPLIAAEVLASDHPFVKTRPLSEATALSKTKARRSAEFLQPYRSRPETCAALARRLVTGALGVKLATARQEREHEKNILREAKEKRRLANKQREDAWEVHAYFSNQEDYYSWEYFKRFVNR